MTERPIVIGTRGSALALAQSTLIRDMLRTAFPRLTCEIKIIKTTGDKMKTASLAKVTESSKGLFTKELEQALLRNQIDLAVHSCKDLPSDVPAGLKLAAVPKREDPRDAFVSKTKMPIPREGIIATSSVRRKAQLLARYPKLEVVEIRGNVDTRLRKLAESTDWQGIILATAGLKRLGYINESRSSELLQFEPPLAFASIPSEVMLPAVGQAALAIETRSDDPRIESIVSRLNHVASFAAVTAERAFLKAFGGGCQIPVAALGVVTGGKLTLRGAVFNEDGSDSRTGEITGSEKEAKTLGRTLATRLLPP
ncbi:MAG: hydroxymethylbilane synthase [Verrucomicrobiae bacterium]|nr:hydroxymethylbilane synthase [Verrucomicrobiae bacterium]